MSFREFNNHFFLFVLDPQVYFNNTWLLYLVTNETCILKKLSRNVRFQTNILNKKFFAPVAHFLSSDYRALFH